MDKIEKFKTFESKSDELKYYADAQGLLRRTAAVKTWNKIGIGKSDVSSWGVFAVDYIEKGEIIEIAPLLIVEKATAKSESLIDYVFKLENDRYALGLGFASLYNHRNQPIAAWNINEQNNTITFTAIRDIMPSEEIFVSYGKNYWKSRGITPKSGFDK